MFGFLPPVAGAIFQEVIDVAVILNALRALGGDRVSPVAAARRHTPAPAGSGASPAPASR